MNLRNVRLLTLAGVPIELHPSSFLMLAFVTWWVATQVYPDALTGRDSSTYVAMGIISGAVFFASVVVHEVAHALAARANAVPVKGITIMVFGGITQTSDVDEPGHELALALAGPAANAVLAAGFLGTWWLIGPNSDRVPDHVLYWLGITNLVIALFNLVPAFPMDGGRVLRAIAWWVCGSYRQATVFAGWLGRIFGWACVSIGILVALQIRGLVIETDVVAWSTGAMLILVGLFLEDSARRGLLQTRVLQALDGYAARDLMVAGSAVVAPGDPIGNLARGVLEVNPRVVYLVEDEGRLGGLLTWWQIRDVPESRWDTVTAGEAMVPTGKLHPIRPDARVTDVMKELEESDLTHAPVVEDGEVLGVLGRDRILGVLWQKGFLRSGQI